LINLNRRNNIDITFISTRKDISLASYRIWVNDLAHYFNEIDIESKILSNIDEKNKNKISKTTIIIIAKTDVKDYLFYRKNYPNNVLGIINPPGQSKYDVDFIIVGSIEEKDSLSQNKNIFIFPLIENKFQNIDRKNYKVTQQERLTLGYHGSYTHLAKFSPNLSYAIEELSKECDISLKVIMDKASPKWKVGRPNINSIEIIEWSLKTFSDDILSCDIGLVPNISDNTPCLISKNDVRGLYKTDYFFRMKNKSNAGRMFVFIQHGIPVIADLTPSNMHILGQPKNGYAVFNKYGWLSALRELKDVKNREVVARNALNSFNDLYNPIVWAEDLLANMKDVLNEKYVK